MEKEPGEENADHVFKLSDEYVSAEDRVLCVRMRDVAIGGLVLG